MKPSLCSAVLIALTGMSCYSNEVSDEDKLSIYSDSATVHYQQNDLARAESQALKGLAIDKHHVPLNLMMGQILLRQDNPITLGRAEMIFRRLADSEDDYRVSIGLATTLERLGMAHAQAAEAIAAGTKKAMEEDPLVGINRHEENALRLRTESLEVFGQALAKRAKNLKALNGSMRVSAALGQFNESLGFCDVLLTTLAAESEFWTSQLQNGNLNEIEESRLRKEVTGASDLMCNASILASTLEQELGRNDAALDRLSFVIGINPDRSEAFSMRAQILADNGKYAEAVADISRFLSLSEKPYHHPDIRKAFELQTTWNRNLRRR
ncbi:MAG: tetratricopeptide (TPR) repeat protein [Planctomycetota bacterium]|jgi:tetratricopeptide (TPR) repeat protein